MPNVDSWSDDRIDALRTYVAEGGSNAKIAVLMNLRFDASYSRNAIIGKVFRLGLQPSKQPTKRVKIVRAPPAPKIHIPQPASPAEPEPLLITLQELTDKTCKYPYGDFPPYLFCGHLPIGGQPYCFKHFNISRRMVTK